MPVPISNIFTRDYFTLQEELMEFHQTELDWFIANLDDLIAGKVSTCKIKNSCYGQKII